MMQLGPRLAAGLVLLLIARMTPAAEDASSLGDGKTPPRFLRLTRDKEGTPLALETPIIGYGPAQDGQPEVSVDLVAAIHIADKTYYEQLNSEFKHYDAVLYELIAPEEANVPRPNDPGSSHPVSLLQNAMKDLLGLEFQLKGIDYTRKNMVHADMSPEQLSESMRKRGESATSILMRMLGYAFTRSNQSSHGPSDGQLLLALFDKNRTLALKRVLAEQFENSEDYMAALDGPAGSTLISGRNQVAIRVLRQEMAADKRKIAIFYGAAHMPDLQQRLRDELGLAPRKTRWLVAWNLKPDVPARSLKKMETGFQTSPATP
jgi:hypothetical protein